MNLVEDKIVRLVTGKPSLNEVSIAELQAIADNQPFFAVAQLLLTQKMKQENHPDTASQLQRTSLYFPNTFWLDYQLQEKVFYVETPVKVAEPITPQHKEDTTPAVIEAIHSLPVEMSSLPAKEEIPVTAKAETVPEETEEKPVLAEEKIIEPVVVPPVEQRPQGHGIMANVEEDVNPLFAAAEVRNEPVVTFVDDDEPVVVEAEPATVPEAEEEEPPLPAITPEEIVAAEEPAVAAPVTSFMEEDEELVLPTIAPKEDVVTEEAPIVEEKTAPIEESFTEEAVENVNFEQSIKEHFKAVIEERPEIDEDNLSVDEIGGPQSGVSNMKIAEMLQQQLEEFKKPVDEHAELPFGADPYHTVDYFASQGIDVDNVPADAMVKKVKRFTDWLKQMKRISSDLSDLGTAKEDEEQVLGIAASSIKSKEVVTEAMARVLVKQGLIDKAIQVYSKLSFLNPDKSAYFATKILELKGN